MNTWTHYHLAKTVDDALQALSSTQGETRLVSGGTDLLLDIQQGRMPAPELLVDLTGVEEMRCLELRGAELFIGAAVPLSRVAESPLVAEHARALTEAAGLIGGPQVRNVATLGGNVGHALPAADGTISLLAMGAQAEVAAPEGRRRVDLAALFAGPGQSNLDRRREVLVGFYLAARQPNEGSAFARVMRPQGVALPILNMGIWLRREGSRVVDVRVAVGPGGPRPHRSAAAETCLCAGEFTPERVELACKALLEDTRFRTSPQRATAAYRNHLSGVLMKDIIQRAWVRAAGQA
ncbi:MAG TPA: FAD binding domain-containing protein [Anaerolineaceae bacterium]|mgnify:CR=1 FL=1|nr:FAD binding domain-containing protein [Anaerolineaceae bacterium]HPN50561.1 FAD binding domain-containing protein [Anaerolineaceae bacterium]